ncbi:MAG: isochorismatase family protein [Acidobacteriota bacterium]|nr:MAG: isochorismatase family protein [Acidobacteriota bacterium]
MYVQTCAASGQPYSRETHGWGIHPKVFPQNEDTTVFKPNSSGFDGTDLDVVLRGKEAEEVTTCGRIALIEEKIEEPRAMGSFRRDAKEASSGDCRGASPDPSCLSIRTARTPRTRDD